MIKKYNVEGIKINYNVDKKDYSDFILKKMEEFYEKVQKQKIPWKVIEDLKKLIIKFPKIPAFKNYLAAAYENLNKYDLLKSILLKTIKDHPEYTLARTSLAKFYIETYEIELAETTLNYANNITELFPEQNVFHYNDIQHFYYVLGLLELEKGNYENVEEIITLLYSLNIDQYILNDLNARLLDYRLSDVQDVSDEDEIEPIITKIITKDSAVDPPILQNEILYKIYTEDFFLANEIIDEIKKSDRKSIIEDLRKILKDAENRYYYFLESDVNYQYFPIHALLILKDLDAEEALEDILDFLRNDEDFLEFWLDDFLTEDCWEIIFMLSKNKLLSLKNFLLEPGIFSFSKSTVLSAMVQAAFENKSEIMEMWKECLDFYNKVNEEDNIISTCFFSLFVSDIFFFDKEYFKKGIKNLFDRELIDESVANSFEELYNYNFTPSQKKILSLSEIYKKYSQY